MSEKGLCACILTELDNYNVALRCMNRHVWLGVSSNICICNIRHHEKSSLIILLNLSILTSDMRVRQITLDPVLQENCITQNSCASQSTEALTTEMVATVHVYKVNCTDRET